MTNKEIHAELEKLSTEFKTKISEHFKFNETIVQLKKLDFSIERTEIGIAKTLSDDSVKFDLKCHINSQGQVVCK